ncbi:MAG: hypothetical protein IPL48_04805 [Bacteroidetes bacterium]|nr:hypothetical protein [Bacteroidota bacterium]
MKNFKSQFRNLDAKLKEMQYQINLQELKKLKKENKNKPFKNLHFYFPSLISLIVAIGTIFILTKNNFFDAKSAQNDATNKNLIYDSKILKDSIASFESNKIKIKLKSDSLNNELLLTYKNLNKANNELLATHENIVNLESIKSDLEFKEEFKEYSLALNNCKIYPTPLYLTYRTLEDKLKEKTNFSKILKDSIYNSFILQDDNIELKALGYRLLILGANDTQYISEFYNILTNTIILYKDSTSRSFPYNLIQTYSFLLDSTFSVPILSRTYEAITDKNFNIFRMGEILSITNNFIHTNNFTINQDFDIYIDLLQINLKLLDKIIDSKQTTYSQIMINLAHLAVQPLVAINCMDIYNVDFINIPVNSNFSYQAHIILENSFNINRKKINSLVSNSGMPQVDRAEDYEIFISEWEIFFENQLINIKQWLDPELDYFYSHPDELIKAINENTF